MVALCLLLSLLVVCGVSQVKFNEILAHTDPPEVDWVELHNAGKVHYNPVSTQLLDSSPVDITGWVLSIGASSYTFPAGSSIGPKAYFVQEVTLERLCARIQHAQLLRARFSFIFLW